MNSGSELVLMDSERISRSLNRMAHEIAEHNGEDTPIDLFGINDRGYVVAVALEKILAPMFNDKVRLFQLPLKKKNTHSDLEDISLPDESYPVIVDDVIFSGKTMFEALNIISSHMSPSEIHTAVLVDRGHRKFPVEAEFYGMELPTKLDEHVSVVVEGQQIESVKLTKSA